jgi:hypothetical protein
MMRKRDEGGLVGVVLTIVIVWALIAVIELTRTTVAAEEINHTVLAITASVSSANGHLSTGCASGNCPLNALPVLNTTISLAQKIQTDAQPLSMQLAQVKTDTASINTTAASILSSAQSINTTVQSINSLVGSIGSSVGSIHSSFVGINTNVATAITPGLVRASDSQVASIVSSVQAIKADTDTINGQAIGILGQAKDICADSAVSLLGLKVTGTICAGG